VFCVSLFHLKYCNEILKYEILINTVNCTVELKNDLHNADLITYQLISDGVMVIGLMGDNTGRCTFFILDGTQYLYTDVIL